MRLQMTFGDELLVTLDTDKWSLSSMSSHVSLKISSLSKLFKTFFERANQYLFFIFWALDFFELLYNQFSVKNDITYNIERIR